MNILQRLTDKPRRAIVECPQCSTVKEMDFYNAKKRTLDTDVCLSCQLTNRNKSGVMQEIKNNEVDSYVNTHNSENNGLYLLKFTDKRTKCEVRCRHCSTTKEISYYKTIFTRYGCENCTKTKKRPTKTRSIYYTSQLAWIFGNMVQRTSNPKSKVAKKAYLSKGITVCEEWLKDRELFYRWSHENGYTKDTKLSIDRRDNDKGYSPENCRWTTKYVQARNTTNNQSNNTSGYRGVSRTTNKLKWRARITVTHIEHHIGVYNTPLEAALAYDNYVLLHNLEHTRNFN